MKAVTGVALLVALAAGGCGSAGERASSTPSTPSTTTARPAGFVDNGQVPTVPDCGAGAYRPATLLIVCGNATTMATGVQWTAWDGTRATGTGTVHITVDGKAETAGARLELSAVKAGNFGPQFTTLTVTWTGASPDGRRSDVYHLGS